MYARDVFYGGVKCAGKLVDVGLGLKFTIQVEAKISYWGCIKYLTTTYSNFGI